MGLNIFWAIIQPTTGYLSKESGRMGGSGHRIGYLHIFTTSPPKLQSSFLEVKTSGDVEVKNGTLKVVSELEGRSCLLEVRSRR